MAGDALSPPRLAYAWQCPQFDEDEHIILRYWLADNDLSIVDFLVNFLPKAEAQLGRDDLLIEVANPRGAAGELRGVLFAKPTRGEGRRSQHA